MDWVNERYVRLYARDSGDWVMLPWQARTVFYELLRKVDRGGTLVVGRGGLRGLALLLRLPEEVVETGAPALFDDGCVLDGGDKVVIPNFLEAQETSQTDKQRKRESRERQRAAVMATATSRRDERSQPVTGGHGPSQPVTGGHSELCLAEPSQAIQSQPPISPPEGGVLAVVASPSPKRRSKQGLAGASPEEAAAVTAVLERLSERTGRKYPPTTEEHALPVLYALRRGYSEDDLRTVVWERANAWAGNERMEEYLRPSTLFGKQKFPEYLAKARAEWDAEERRDRQLERGRAPPPSPLVAGLLGAARGNP